MMLRGVSRIRDLPDGLRIMRANLFAGRDERSIVIGFGVRNDHEIERVARPGFEQGGFGEIGKRAPADLNSDLHAQLFGEILGRPDDAAGPEEKIQFEQNGRRDQKIVLVNGVESVVAEFSELTLTEPNHDVGVHVGDQRSDQSLLASSRSTPLARTG